MLLNRSLQRCERTSIPLELPEELPLDLDALLSVLGLAELHCGSKTVVRALGKG